MISLVFALFFDYQSLNLFIHRAALTFTNNILDPSYSLPSNLRVIFSHPYIHSILALTSFPSSSSCTSAALTGPEPVSAAPYSFAGQTVWLTLCYFFVKTPCMRCTIFSLRIWVLLPFLHIEFLGFFFSLFCKKFNSRVYLSFLHSHNLATVRS